MQKTYILKYDGKNVQTELKRVSFPPVAKLKEVIKIDGFGNVPVQLRRLRQQEAEKLDAIDQQIAELRAQREKLMQEAWNKANVVTVKELVEQAN